MYMNNYKINLHSVLHSMDLQLHIYACSTVIKQLNFNLDEVTAIVITYIKAVFYIIQSYKANSQ